MINPNEKEYIIIVENFSNSDVFVTSLLILWEFQKSKTYKSFGVRLEMEV